MECGHESLRRLFDLATAVPADKRDALLDRECCGDVALKKRVEAMLAAAEDEQFLGRPTAGSAEDSAVHATVDLPHQSNDIGHVVAAVLGEGPGSGIGPYKLLQLIGEGGFGSVFMAEQQSPVSRKVALKIIKLGMDTKQVIARFEAERQALAMMDHPSIAKIFDAGATETGRPYFVMELCDGDPIVTYCDKQNLSINERLELFAQVCQAVQHAHTKGVIHRDIKPSNILVAIQDGKPHAKVIDFGIAKATNSKLTERTYFTEHRQLVGTLEYMSPEQAEGNLDIDTRTDVYSLGVVLYELLTGTTPIGSVVPRSGGFSEIQRMIIEVDPPKPSTKLSQSTDTLPAVAAARRSEPRKLSAIVRGELDWIVMKALEKDRRRRYETANSFASDIRRYLNGEAVVAAPPSKLYQFRKFVRRHKAVAGAAAVLLLAMVGLAAALLAVNRERMRAENALASEAASRKRTRQALDDMTAQVMENWMARQQKLDPSQKAFLEKALASYEEFAQQSGENAESRWGIAGAYKRVFQLHYKLGRLQAAEEAARRAVDVLEQLREESYSEPSFESEYAGSFHNVGVLLARTGRHKDAEPYYRKALEIRKRMFEESPTNPLFAKDLASSYILIGNLLLDREQRTEAIAEHQNAVAILKKLVVDSPKEWRYRNDLALTYYNLAGALRGLNRFPDAEAAYRASIDLRRELNSEFPAQPEYRNSLAMSLQRLGQLLAATGQMKDAEGAYRESLSLQNQLAADFPAVPEYRNEAANTHVVLATLLGSTDRIPEAEASFQAAVALQKQLTTDHPEAPEYRGTLASTLVNLGVFLYGRGRLREAEASYRESLEIRKQLADEDPKNPASRANLALVHYNLALVLGRLDRLQEAEQCYRDCIAIQKQLVTEFPAVPRYRFVLANCYGALSLVLEKDRPDEAEAGIREALALHENLAADFPNVQLYRQELSVSQRNLGHALKNAQRPTEARESLAKAQAINDKLIAESPSMSHYRFERALALHALAELSRDACEFAEAKALLERAELDFDVAMKANPDGPNYRLRYRLHRGLQAQVAAGLGNRDSALQIAETISNLGWNPPHDAYDSVCALAKCAAVVNADTKLSEAERRDLAAPFNDRAVQTLRDAIAKGYKDLDKLQKDKDLDSLRSRDDFQKLVADLEASLAPAK